MEAELAKPRNVMHTLYKLHDWIKKGLVDINPDFQRGTTIKRYFNNEGLDGMSRNVLSEEAKEHFECYEFVCVEYYDLSLVQEHEIFSRVQLGVPLTTAEKLAVINTPITNFAQNLYRSYPSISKIIDTKRGKPLQVISQALLIIEDPEKCKSTVKCIENYLKDDREVPFELSQTVKQVFETLSTLIDVNVQLFHENHKFSPIEFVFFCCVIARFPGIGIDTYQDYLKSMKEYVRRYHVDVRFNQKVYMTLKKFIDELDQEEELVDELWDDICENDECDELWDDIYKNDERVEDKNEDLESLPSKKIKIEK
ncbi:10475_t:CDS:2 [Dentiscutata erythropus]|uniref:10475_t:CDS:1 n=1 Tax=Dentiscutata erythropus TaxID=1348616 RepID=A0A9N9HQY9_9GLOM|nr:10475_t:CDS:2 [Dentiscutata erythropus]